MAACPYDAIFTSPEDHSAEKCNLCAHRIDVGLEPACVSVCPTEAILVGDLNDPTSKVAQLVQRKPALVQHVVVLLAAWPGAGVQLDPVVPALLGRERR